MNQTDSLFGIWDPPKLSLLGLETDTPEQQPQNKEHSVRIIMAYDVSQRDISDGLFGMRDPLGMA